jgi:hypothetical protein
MSFPLTNSVAPEPEGSSSRSQDPATGHNPEPTGSTPHPTASLPKIHSDPIFPSTPRSSQWFLSFKPSHQNPVQLSLLSHACHMSRPPHPPGFDLPNNEAPHCTSSSILLLLHHCLVQIISLEPWSHCRNITALVTTIDLILENNLERTIMAFTSIN